jgi:putative FmdB family regulatory protein
VPTYAYACTACGHAFDAVQKFSDSALTECPECSGRLRKVYTSIGVTFKGSGFYRNDSRAGANGSSKGTDGSSASGDKASSDAKGPDAKGPDAKGSSDSKGASESSGSSGTSTSSDKSTTGSKAASGASSGSTTATKS